jgi:hypothetical protein
MFYAGETQSNNWFMAQSNNTIDFTRWIDLPPSKYVVPHRYAIIYNSKYDSDSVFNSSRGITTAVAISSSFTASTSPKTCQNRLLKKGYLNEAPCGACTVNLRLCSCISHVSYVNYPKFFCSVGILEICMLGTSIITITPPNAS